MRIKNIFLVGVFILTLIAFNSCSSYASMIKSDSRIKNVELNMTKKEVIAIMGNSYQIIGKEQDKGGLVVEVLGYMASGGCYKLFFCQDVLFKWDKEWDNLNRGCERDVSSAVNNVVAPSSQPVVTGDTHMDAHRNIMLSGAKTDAERRAINTHMDAHQGL